MNGILVEQFKFVQALAPAADRWNGNPATDIISLKNYAGIAFLVEQSLSTSTAGTVTFTVQRCTSSTGANASAIPFTYSVRTASDTWSAAAAATSAGYANPSSTAPSSVLIEIEDQALPAGSTLAYNFVRVVGTEASSPPARVASVSAILRNPRFKASTLPTALS